MATYDEQIKQYLGTISEQTKAQKLSWLKQNPTTFTAEVTSANARMSLQRVVKPAGIARSAGGQIVRTPSRENYVFQVMDFQGGQPVLSLSANTSDPDYAALKNLFDSAEDAAKQRGADLLRKIIQG